jgi:hypothetical protein
MSHVKNIMLEYPSEKIMNVDETYLRSVSPGFWISATTGTESVCCRTENDEKKGITVIAGVNAGGARLPLTIIGKGTIFRCLSAYNLPSEVWTTTSKSGWITSNLMCRDFQPIRQHLYPAGLILLILDTYAARRAVVTKAAAAVRGVELVLISPECTGRLQALDRRIFGIPKVHARELWRTYYHATNGGKTPPSTMAQNLLTTWEHIRPEIIESSWNIFQEK